MIETKILAYLGHLQDGDYMAEIVMSEPLPEVCDRINSMLQSDEEETVSQTCLFIRDIQFKREHPDCKVFVENYPHSSIVETLEQLVFSSNHFICKEAIYTLGKTCSYSSVEALTKAFTDLRNSDPLVLPRLLGELGWLGATNFWELLDSITSSPIYVTRWAAIEVLQEFIISEEQSVKIQQHRQRLNQLRQDPNGYVRQEAEYEYQLLEYTHSSEGKTLPKAERRKQRKELERRYKPALPFSHISSAFTYHLFIQGSKQYSVSELQAFINELAQNQSDR